MATNPVVPSLARILGKRRFPAEHLTTHLPWQDRAVLVGPFYPSVVSTQWYFRQQRHRRRSSKERKDYPESIYRCSVPVPVKQVRGLLALLYDQIEQILIAPTQDGAWSAGFPTRYESFDKDRFGHYYSVNLFDPMLEKKLGLGTSPEHDTKVRPWLTVRNFARLRIQLLREQGYRNGGWWPAPYYFEVRVYNHDRQFKYENRRLFRVKLWFAPHFMAGERQAVEWPRPRSGKPRPPQQPVLVYL
jgi:hypothetical protein